MNTYAVSLRHLSPLSFAAPPRARRSAAEVNVHIPSSAAGLFFVGIAVLLVLLAAGFAYIRQVNTSAVGGYDVSSLEHTVNALKDQEQQLRLQSAELQSLSAIEEGSRSLNFVPATQVAFTSPIVHGSVAYRTGDGTY